ncbi:MAG: flagellar hook-associated protein FlgL [Geobacteraceae bacterium]|nr:flagellar hook-associated protein FlgL [Geobacteraceae bacterium]
MRITSGMTANNALYYLQKESSRLNLLNEQVASGLVINRPSDDPISTRQILDMNSDIKSGDQYLSNITKSNMWLSTTDTALQGMAGFISQAKKLAGTITSGSSDQTVRDNAVSQLTELKKQLVDMGNTQLGDQYIFAGFDNNSPPFSVASNVYNGTSDDISVGISNNSTVAMNITGDDLLKGTGSYGSVDILSTLDNLVTAITNNNPTDIQAAAAQLDESSDQITNARSDVASKMTRLKSAKTMITQNQNTLSNIVSDMQNVDYTKAAVELNQQQTAYEAALSTTAKIMQMSLLDYLS